jgi:trehalose 6-phosphate synthase
MAFPIGIDVDAFVREADRSDGARRLHLPPDEVLIIGVDRLDYSKGLVNRFEAFGTYLDRRAPGEARATFLQIAPPSRAALDAYQDIRRALETMAGSVNGAHAELDWTPIRYIRRNVPRPTVAGLLRRANVALVTPFADGMNLVAKEYVAAQQPDDPGVLILSHFAGAAERMTEALLVNPYDVAGMAEAIRTAVAMPRAERRQRHAALLAGIREHDIARWTAAFLGALAAPPPPDHSLASLFMGTRPVAGAA